MFGAVPLVQVNSSSFASWSANITSSLFCADRITAPAFTVFRQYLAHYLCSSMLLSNSTSLLLGNFAIHVLSITCPISAIMKFCFCFINHLGKSSCFPLNDSTLIVQFWLVINIIDCIISFVSFTGSILSELWDFLNHEISNYFQWRFHLNRRSSTTSFPHRVLDVSQSIRKILRSMLRHLKRLWLTNWFSHNGFLNCALTYFL